MTEKVSRALTVYVSGNSCNLRCPYCYVKNSHPNEIPKPMCLKYPLKQMVRAFDPRRIGGIAEVTVIGSAETLLAKEVIPFVHGLLHFGHVVTVVSNATLPSRVDELLDCPKEDLKNLILKASFHYEELKRRQLLDVYFQNIKNAISHGASAYPFVVISPEYSKHIKEIGELITENLGIKAHCSPCNSINNEFDLQFHSEFDPKPTEKLMEELDHYFDTRIYRECVRYKEVDVQNTFCYAGRWSLGIDMATGHTFKCHNFRKDNENFYENVDKPYSWGMPIGMSCAIESCCLQYNFFSENILPDFPGKYSFGQLLYQKGMISEYIRDKLDVKFDDIYGRETPGKEAEITLANKNIQIRRLENELMNSKLGNPFMSRKVSEMVRRGKKIAVYGRGGLYKKYKAQTDVEISCFLDSYAEGGTFEGKKVYRPEQLADKQNYFVVTCATDRSTLYENLRKAGFSRDQYI